MVLTERWDRAGTSICFDSGTSSGQIPAFIFVAQILFGAVLKSMVNLEEIGADALEMEPRNSIKVVNLGISTAEDRGGWVQMDRC